MATGGTGALGRAIASYARNSLPHGLVAAILLTLFAVVLNAGVALASGAPVELGLASAIVGALVVGAIGESGLQITAPAASLAVGVWTLLGADGGRGVELLGPAVVLAGALQIAIGLLRIGSWFRIIAPAVIPRVLSRLRLPVVLSHAFALLHLRP